MLLLKILQVSNIKNFLLIGTDGREGEQSFRSDCMIIATMDMKHKSIKAYIIGS